MEQNLNKAKIDEIRRVIDSYREKTVAMARKRKVLDRELQDYRQMRQMVMSKIDELWTLSSDEDKKDLENWVVGELNYISVINDLASQLRNLESGSYMDLSSIDEIGQFIDSYDRLHFLSQQARNIEQLSLKSKKSDIIGIESAGRKINYIDLGLADDYVKVIRERRETVLKQRKLYNRIINGVTLEPNLTGVSSVKTDINDIESIRNELKAIRELGAQSNCGRKVTVLYNGESVVIPRYELGRFNELRGYQTLLLKKQEAQATLSFGGKVVDLNSDMLFTKETTGKDTSLSNDEIVKLEQSIRDIIEAGKTMDESNVYHYMYRGRIVAVPVDRVSEYSRYNTRLNTILNGSDEGIDHLKANGNNLQGSRHKIESRSHASKQMVNDISSINCDSLSSIAMLGNIVSLDGINDSFDKESSMSTDMTYDEKVAGDNMALGIEKVEENDGTYVNDFVIGAKVNIRDGSYVYQTTGDAIMGKNMYMPRFGYDEVRTILGVTLEDNMTLKTIMANMDDANLGIDNLIRNDGAKVVSVLTTCSDVDIDIDGVMDTEKLSEHAEGWFNVSSIDLALERSLAR